MFEKLTARVQAWYQPYQKYGPVGAFVIGFLYDTITLTRIDKLSDNLVLLGYAVAAGALITIIGRIERGRMTTSWFARHLDVVTLATHFFLGGMLSSYVVFYFKSAGVGKTYLFVILLIGLLLANEFFAHRLRNLKLLIALYYFCCFAFLTFFLPVMTHVMGDGMFVLSGLLSFVPMGAVVALIYNGRLRQNRQDATGLVPLPVVIFATLICLYFLNWMPPVPLSLKSGGIYRSVKRVGDKYEVQYRQPRWWQLWKSDERDFECGPGDMAYCFTAVFAPTALNERIVHEWQQQSSQGEWVTRDKHSYPIAGGREGGYRGYSLKRNISSGEWRVEVKTMGGRLLGRISFEVVAVQQSPSQIEVADR